MCIRDSGYPAPGLIIGGYMVELAKRHMPEGVLYDAVSETAHCLPDAVQLLTPCTFGNGWLRVLPFGIYAVTLYDKATGEGVRVELDNDKLEPYDAIRSWFLKERPKKEQDTERLQAQIKEAGESILSFRKVRIRQDMLGHRSFGAITRLSLIHISFWRLASFPSVRPGTSASETSGAEVCSA